MAVGPKIDLFEMKNISKKFNSTINDTFCYRKTKAKTCVAAEFQNNTATHLTQFH